MAPGFFAKVRIPGSAEYDGLLIRDAAIADDQGSSFVWVIDNEHKAVYRPVALGPLARWTAHGPQPACLLDERVIVIEDSWPCATGSSPRWT
jgi:multidrug efflux pump subunit AcrA (membrane-fusion protein)